MSVESLWNRIDTITQNGKGIFKSFDTISRPISLLSCGLFSLLEGETEGLEMNIVDHTLILKYHTSLVSYTVQ